MTNSPTPVDARPAHRARHPPSRPSPDPRPSGSPRYRQPPTSPTSHRLVADGEQFAVLATKRMRWIGRSDDGGGLEPPRQRRRARRRRRRSPTGVTRAQLADRRRTGRWTSDASRRGASSPERRRRGARACGGVLGGRSMASPRRTSRRCTSPIWRRRRPTSTRCRRRWRARSVSRVSSLTASGTWEPGDVTERVRASRARLRLRTLIDMSGRLTVARARPTASTSWSGASS